MAATTAPTCSKSNLPTTLLQPPTAPPGAELSQDDESVSPLPPLSPRPVRPSVYVTRRIPQVAVETLLKQCDIRQWDSELSVPRGELLHSVCGVNGILCMASDVIDAQVLDAAGPNLRVIATVSSESEHIDQAECGQRGIQVLHCPTPHNTDHYAELTVALVLLTLRETLTEEECIANFEPHAPDLITSSSESLTLSWLHNRPRVMRRMSEERLAFQWSNGKPSNTNCPTWKNIASKTFGVYGLTKVGYRVANILKSFGVEHILLADCDAELDNSGFVNKTPEDFQVVPFDQLLQESDVICVCGDSSGQQSSKLVFNKESFQKMSPKAVVIASHHEEESIDYVGLYEALRDGQIKAAGLNDCNQGPVPFKEFLQGLKNCIFLPQTQESVYDTRHKVSVMMAKNLSNAIKMKLETLAE